jgi:hypothetical protein
MKKFFEKYVLAKYIVNSFLKTLIISLFVFPAIFFVLYYTGLYFRLETALDLKYNSPFVLIPLWSSIALALLCFFIGCLMYFYKYKRSKSKSKFYATFSNLLDDGKIS